MNLPQFPTNPACDSCALHAAARHRCVPTVWMPGSLPPAPSNRAVVFVGQNPGYEEDRRNEPFVGRSGKMVREDICTPLGLVAPNPRAAVYLTNVARCVGDPIKSHYKQCAPRYLLPDLIQILSSHAATCVVALGAPAATHVYALCGHKDISFAKARSKPGALLTLDNHPFTIHAAFHPAYILRNPPAKYALAEQLSGVADWLNGFTLTPSQPMLVPPFAPTEVPRTTRCPTR